jgi:hypothetical protein
MHTASDTESFVLGHLNGDLDTSRFVQSQVPWGANILFSTSQEREINSSFVLKANYNWLKDPFPMRFPTLNWSPTYEAIL